MDFSKSRYFNFLYATIIVHVLDTNKIEISISYILYWFILYQIPKMAQNDEQKLIDLLEQSIKFINKQICDLDDKKKELEHTLDVITKKKSSEICYGCAS